MDALQRYTSWMKEGQATIQLEEIVVEAARGKRLLDAVSLQIERGEAVSVIGRSGAGKSTLLKVMNRLIVPGAGRVVRDGEELSAGNEIAVRRATGYILQSAALFPHRSVYDNVALVPRLLGWPETKIRTAASETLARLALPLDRFGTRFPRSLSGGEQQRVAIARATVSQPSVLLCDEPFSALDPIVRREQQQFFLNVQADVERTVVFVTHDVNEALRIGQRIVLIEQGRIVVDLPRHEFVKSSHELVQAFLDGTRIPA